MGNNYLIHHGVKGQKWGIRRTATQLGHKVKTNHLAKKDAKEFARAKMFYGEGAGNRRKLIKAKVEQRSKDHEYKQKFDEYLNKQDMAKHATKAKNERVRKDATQKVVKTSRGVANLALGNMAKVSASAAIIYSVGKASGADKVVVKMAKQAMRDFSPQVIKAKIALRRMGM